MHRRPWEATALAAAVFLCAPSAALAHGFAGQRFFPATLLTDDPFVADEISLQTLTRPPSDADGAYEYDLDVDLAKRLTPDLGLTLGYGWADVHSPGMKAVSGFGPLRTGLQYQLFVDAPHEAIGLANLSVTWAHTGRVQALGAPDFTTLSPGFDFGKGFGDLPASVPFLRPIAVTGNLGFDFPTKAESAGTANPDNFNYGFALEYSLPYLQCCVEGCRAAAVQPNLGATQDTSTAHCGACARRTPGLSMTNRRPRRLLQEERAPGGGCYVELIPLVELAFSTPINRITPGVPQRRHRQATAQC